MRARLFTTGCYTTKSRRHEERTKNAIGKGFLRGFVCWSGHSRWVFRRIRGPYGSSAVRSRLYVRRLPADAAARRGAEPRSVHDRPDDAVYIARPAATAERVGQHGHNHDGGDG